MEEVLPELNDGGRCEHKLLLYESFLSFRQIVMHLAIICMPFTSLKKVGDFVVGLSFETVPRGGGLLTKFADYP